MKNYKSFLVTDAERKHVRRSARFQQHRDASSHQFFSLQGKAPKEIHAILTETLGEHAPTYATVKNWVAQFKRGDFSPCDAPRPGRPKTVTTPKIIDQIQELILEDSCHHYLGQKIRKTNVHPAVLFYRTHVAYAIALEKHTEHS